MEKVPIKTYVVDIDGTICSQAAEKQSDYSNARPIRIRIDKMNKLYDEGNILIYCTARGMGRSAGDQIASNVLFYEKTMNQLNSWGVKFHALYLGKPAGDVYIDDKGINAEDFFKD